MPGFDHREIHNTFKNILFLFTVFLIGCSTSNPQEDQAAVLPVPIDTNSLPDVNAADYWDKAVLSDCYR